MRIQFLEEVRAAAIDVHTEDQDCPVRVFHVGETLEIRAIAEDLDDEKFVVRNLEGLYFLLPPSSFVLGQSLCLGVDVYYRSMN